jgi:Aromatic-ring-opening dioxygenase LigAB, LigA subunit
MSVYTVNYLLRELLRDHAFRAAMKDDPAEALKKCDITEEERKLLLAGDVGGLHRLGVNDFLMGYLPRFGIAGLDPKAYGERISKEAPGVR